MELWGLTGLAGSGKSLALKFLKKHGAAVIDSDQAARDVVDPQRLDAAQTLQEIQDAFGSQVIDEKTGELKRRELRAQIVQSLEKQKKLEAILHPKILNKIQEWVRVSEQAGYTVGVVEGTRLVESGFVKQLQGLIVVTAPLDLQLRRLQARDNLSELEARALLSVQNLDVMKRASSVEWINQGPEEKLEQQVIEFLKSRNLKEKDS